MKLAERIFRRKDYYITSPFGYRTDPITGKKGTFHDGVDYGTNLQKWNQYALEDGKVLSCGLDANYANAKYVWVEYPRLGIKLLHYHLDSIKVSKGQAVNENTVLGTTGKTGLATGIHLHLGMKYLKDNVYVDAEKYDYQPPTPSPIPTYVVGKVYTLNAILKVRYSAGTSYKQKTYSQLTTNAKMNAYASGNNSGCLKVGTKISCLEVRTINKEIWLRIPSGWVCAYQNGNTFIK